MVQKVIAIDPGYEKCGVAAMEQNGKIIYKAVIKTHCLFLKAQELVNSQKVNVILLGDRTGRQIIKKLLNKIIANKQTITIITVNEHGTTDEAKKRYWRENPPRGLRRFIPLTMQVPPCPIDDYVAVILAEKFFKIG